MDWINFSCMILAYTIFFTVGYHIELVRVKLFIKYYTIITDPEEKELEQNKRSRLIRRSFILRHLLLIICFGYVLQTRETTEI